MVRPRISELGTCVKLNLNEILERSKVLLVVDFPQAGHDKNSLLVRNGAEGEGLEHEEHRLGQVAALDIRHHGLLEKSDLAFLRGRGTLVGRGVFALDGEVLVHIHANSGQELHASNSVLTNFS